MDWEDGNGMVKEALSSRWSEIRDIAEDSEILIT